MDFSIEAVRGRRIARLLLAFALALLIVPLRADPSFARRRPHHGRAAAKSELTQPYAEACLMEPTTGAIIFQKNMNQPWPTASLAKMMEMLIVAQRLRDGSLKLSERITTSRKAAEMGGSQVYLKEGETFSLDDMMKAVAVHSANDACVAVAEYIAGSTQAFVAMMNREAARLGMTNTRYYSVHGLPPGPGEKADVSSAHDEALLARALVRYPVVLRWTSIDTAPFRHGTFELRNTNHLVRTYGGCDGLKTGYYHAAGFNVVATAHRHGLRLIAVVLGSPHKLTNFKIAAELMSQGFAGYEMYPVARRGTPIPRSLAVNGGTARELKPVWGGNVSVFVKRDGQETVRVAYELPAALKAPVAAGQQVGTAVVQVDGRRAAETKLLAPQAIGRASLLHRWF